MKSYSQHGEDKWIADRYKELGLPEIGTFVEVGAGDGVHLSNTLWLEERGWRGLCVEPDPRAFFHLYRHRLCRMSTVAVSATEEEFVDFTCHEHFELSGLARPDGGKIKVATKRLDTLMNECGFSFIDVLSIDTEGTEIDVLDSANLSRVNILIVEHDTTGLPSNKEALMARLTPEFKLLETFPYNFIFQRIK